MRPRYRHIALASVLVASTALLASADDERRDRPRRASIQSPEEKQYRAECGSCHLAYPPRLLPAASWKALLHGLDEHFGQSAELEATTRAELSTWLEAAAGRTPRRTRLDQPPPSRITELSWFRHEHDELDAAVWKRSSILTPANCPACHADAEQWQFDEDRVRIPR